MAVCNYVECFSKFQLVTLSILLHYCTALYWMKRERERWKSIFGKQIKIVKSSVSSLALIWNGRFTGQAQLCLKLVSGFEWDRLQDKHNFMTDGWSSALSSVENSTHSRGEHLRYCLWSAVYAVEWIETLCSGSKLHWNTHCIHTSSRTDTETCSTCQAFWRRFKLSLHRPFRVVCWVRNVFTLVSSARGNGDLGQMCLAAE